jgi:peptide-methionine (S)-S-oxide reductase
MLSLYEHATFGAGCFWGVEEAFRVLPGVVLTAVGYSGGHTKNPSYESVCTNTTGHAEVVDLSYDPSVISYESLLKKFWDIHDPTTLNRQGPDIGSQYRSVIFYHNDNQREIAEQMKKLLQESKKFFPKTVVTEIVPASTFYRAEEYHQRYFEKRGGGTCHT